MVGSSTGQPVTPTLPLVLLVLVTTLVVILYYIIVLVLYSYVG